MRTGRVLWIIGGVALLGLAGFGAWMLTLPAAARADGAPVVPAPEEQAALALLEPPKRERPLVAIIGINDATETTDYLMPYGILRRAGIDVVSLATDAGPVRLYPALTVEPDATIAAFDARHPDGADYVIVPAMSRDDDPAALAWIRSQAAKGAIVIGVCAGAKVVAAAGLLEGRRATTHWFYLDELASLSPGAVYVPDRRLVVDEGVATTTGISASMPMMLTLIEAIAGRARAEAVAHELGMPAWSARHDSDAFTLTRPFAVTVMRNTLARWNREELGIELAPGMDEVTLALVADAWSRTYRSRAVTLAPTRSAVATRNGARILPDRAAGDERPDRLVELGDRPPAAALDATLAGIAQRYGAPTASVVAMQLEYPLRRSRAGH